MLEKQNFLEDPEVLLLNTYQTLCGGTVCTERHLVGGAFFDFIEIAFSQYDVLFNEHV